MEPREQKNSAVTTVLVITVLVLALLIPELDQEARDALKHWAAGKRKKD